MLGGEPGEDRIARSAEEADGGVIPEGIRVLGFPKKRLHGEARRDGRGLSGVKACARDCRMAATLGDHLVVGSALRLEQLVRRQRARDAPEEVLDLVTPRCLDYEVSLADELLKLGEGALARPLHAAQMDVVWSGLAVGVEPPTRLADCLRLREPAP